MSPVYGSIYYADVISNFEHLGEGYEAFRITVSHCLSQLAAHTVEDTAINDKIKAADTEFFKIHCD